MSDYKKMYQILFNAITDATGQIQQRNIGFGLDILEKAQQATEEIYMQSSKTIVKEVSQS